MHLLPFPALFNFSTSTLTQLLDRFGYPLVSVFVAIESSGIPFPGETMLVTAAVYAGTGGHLSIVGIIVAAAAGIIGFALLDDLEHGAPPVELPLPKRESALCHALDNHWRCV